MVFYYSADGKRFDSKVEALAYKKYKNIEVGFYYHDDVWSKVDWKTEPPGSLDFYYKEQAQRLRDTYDYLILCYSGGFDSTNILETFFYNNIKLDKIVIVGAFSQDSKIGSDENHNGELYHNAFPLIHKLGLENITEVYDYTEQFNSVDSFSIAEYGAEWINATGGWFSPHNWWWKDAGKVIVPSNLGSKRAAIIFGRDKPRILFNKFYFYDTGATSYGNIQNGDNYDVINFYWDPGFTPILVKQVHVLKNTPNLNMQIVEPHIYNLRNPLVFRSGKSVTSLLSLRDQYMHNKVGSRAYDIYRAGIKYMYLRLQNIMSIPPLHTRGYSLV